MALSDNMKQKRVEAGMTMEQVAERAGTTRQQIDKYERNVSKPQPETFVLIARALGTTCEELVNGKENVNERIETF